METPLNLPTTSEIQSDLGGPSPSPNPGSASPDPIPSSGADGGRVTQGPADAEPMYEVTVGGKKWKVPVSELTKGYQRTQDYTRKTMELAEQRRSWDQERTEFQKQVDELRKWLENPANVYQYYQQLARTKGFDPSNPSAFQPNQPQIDPRELESSIEARLEQKFQMQYLTNQYKAEIDKAIERTLETHSDLKVVRGIERLIREDVAGRDPANIQEALQLVGAVASERVEALKSLKAQMAAQTAQQSSPLQNGIEPPGGTAPQPEPRNGNLKLGSKELTDAILRDLAAASVR